MKTINRKTGYNVYTVGMDPHWHCTIKGAAKRLLQDRHLSHDPQIIRVSDGRRRRVEIPDDVFD